MIHKKGNKLHSDPSGEIYARAIADALRVELGGSHRAIKMLTKWTGASERTAKNWLSGSCGPRGEHLVKLARESDAVLAALLSLCGRHDHLVGASLLEIRNALAAATSLLEALLTDAPAPAEPSLPSIRAVETSSH